MSCGFMSAPLGTETPIVPGPDSARWSRRGPARPRAIRRRRFHSKVMGEAHEVFDRGPLIHSGSGARDSESGRPLSVAGREGRVVVAHGRGKDELGLAHDVVTMLVDREVDEPEPEPAKLELEGVEPRRPGGRQVPRDEGARVVADLRDELAVEGFLGVEVSVEGPDRKLGAVRHLVDVRLEEALVPEEPAPGLEEALARPLLEGDGEGRRGPAEDLFGIEVEAAEESVRENAADRLELDRGGVEGPVDRAEPEAAEGEEVFGEADLPSEGRAEAPRVDGDEAPLVLEVAVLALAEHRDEVGVLLGEADDRLGIAAQALAGRFSVGALECFAHLVENPAEDDLEEGFLVVVVAVKDAVREASRAAHLGHGHGAVPLLREELACVGWQAFRRLLIASALVRRARLLHPGRQSDLHTLREK